MRKPDRIDTLMKDYWDAVDARQPERAAEIMKKIGEATRTRGVGVNLVRRDRYLGGKNVRW